MLNCVVKLSQLQPTSHKNKPRWLSVGSVVAKLAQQTKDVQRTEIWAEENYTAVKNHFYLCGDRRAGG